MKTIEIGMLGLGTVASGVGRLRGETPPPLERMTGPRLRLGKIAVRDARRPRGAEVDPKLLTTNAAEVLDDPGIHIVGELMGGTDPARAYCLRALESGKHVVTANKALLATHGPEP